MKTQRPKLQMPQRVYVTARDPDTGKSETKTFYDTTPQGFFTTVAKALRSREKPQIPLSKSA